MARRGRRRLWVVATVLWVAWMAWQTALVSTGGPTAETLAFALRWAVGPPAVVYLIGVVAVWVAGGFREPDRSGPPVRSA